MSGASGTETYRDSSLKDDTFSFCHQCVLGEVLLGGAPAEAVYERTAVEDKAGPEETLGRVQHGSPSLVQGEMGVTARGLETL